MNSVDTKRPRRENPRVVPVKVSRAPVWSCAVSAGTGKTIVALHRAVFLARANPSARILLTTFSDTLSNALRTKLRRLISNEPRLGERVEVYSMNAIGRRLYEVNFCRPQIATRETIREHLNEAAERYKDTSSPCISC